jgi:type IV secretory pathway VirB2 component (pilin)
MHSFQPVLSDPPAGSPLAEGVAWVEGAALGSTATIVAVIAVAAIGLLMLSGRLDIRRGITVVLGCFILFGAGGIAAAITGLSGADANPKSENPRPASPLPRTEASPYQPGATYDPYAGASVPNRR